MYDVDLVSFDYWNTLVHESQPGALVAARLPVIRDLLRSAGHDVSIDQLMSAHAVAQAEFEATSASGVIYQTIHAADRIHQVLELPVETVELIDRGFDVGSAQADVSVVAGVPEVLRRLRRAELKLAIVCDVGLTPSSVLMDWLDRHQLADHFAVTAFSDRVGEYKPGRAMFDHITSVTGVDDPARVVHIGDRRRTDVAGAHRFGAHAVRFSGVYDDKADLPDAEVVLGSMSEFADSILASRR